MAITKVDYGTLEDKPFQKIGTGVYGQTFTKIDNKSAYYDMSSIDPNGELVLYETLFPVLGMTRTSNVALTDCIIGFSFSYDTSTKRLILTASGNAPQYFNFNNSAGASPIAGFIYYKI